MNPAEEWMLQIARNACDVDEGVLSEGRKLSIITPPRARSVLILNRTGFPTARCRIAEYVPGRSVLQTRDSRVKSRESPASA